MLHGVSKRISVSFSGDFMPGPLPIALRERVLAAHQNKEGTVEELAERFMVGPASIKRWLARVRKTESVAPSPMGGARRPYKVQGEGADAVRLLLDTVPESTLLDACEVYRQVTQIEVSDQTMSDAVRRFGYTKKRGSFVRLQPPNPGS